LQAVHTVADVQVVQPLIATEQLTQSAVPLSM
jgi:hypothetical protein